MQARVAIHTTVHTLIVIQLNWHSYSLIVVTGAVRISSRNFGSGCVSFMHRVPPPPH